MKTLLKPIFVVVLLVFACSCQDSTIKTNEEIKYLETKEKIAKEWTRFFDAWVKLDPIKSASFFHEDGIHFRPGAAIDTGRVKIEKTFSRIFSAHKVEYCQQKTLDIELFGNKIIEYGTYEQKWAGADKIMKGSYIAIWKKFDQDSIKISRLIFN